MNDELFNLKWAYTILDVDKKSCAHTIKRKYRSLMKKWHPDKWVKDPDGHKKALSKTKEINSAYEKIKHAPLRYHIDSHPKAKDNLYQRQRARQTQSKRHTRSKENFEFKYRKYSKIQGRGEFWFRFVSGYILGMLCLYFFAAYKHGRVPYDCFDGDWHWIEILIPVIIGLINTRVRDNLWFSLFDHDYWFR